MIAWRYFSSSLLRFPFTPTMGWLQRVTVAWLSGWIHDNTYTRQIEGCERKAVLVERLHSSRWQDSDSLVSSPLPERPPLSSALRLVYLQVPQESTGRCHKVRSDRSPSLSSSSHWVYPFIKHRHITCSKLSVTSSQEVEPCQFRIPVFCIRRGCHTPSNHSQGRLVRIQRQIFAAESGRETDQSVHSAELQCQGTVWVTITHQPIGNRKGKFHQYFKNGLPECVLQLFVCKS